MNDTPGSLLNDIKNLLRTYLELADRDYEIGAHFVLSTWFSDLSRVAPYLWIIGPFSCGKARSCGC
jgi:hypothetical protein